MSEQLELPCNQEPSHQIKLFSRFQLLAVTIATLLLVLSIAYSSEILLMIKAVRFSPLNEVMLFITNRGFAIIVSALALVVLYRKKIPEIALIAISVGVSLGLGYIIKKVFQEPRPYAEESLSNIALATTYGFSFPSLHAALCFSIIPFLKDILHKKWLYWGVTGLLYLIVISRIYIGVHYLDDVIVGGLLGYIVAKVFLYFQTRYHIVQEFLRHVKDKFELRRQIAHMLTGTALLFLIKFGFVNATVLAVILAIGGIMILVSLRVRIPMLEKILHYFDREKDRAYFPAKGAFYFIMGCAISLVLFEYNIALASIAIMTYGDAITTIAGTYFGKTKNPLNPNKHLEGTFSAIIVSTVIAFAFVRFPQAFLGSAAGMFVESLTIRFIDKPLDDNVIIPIIAGITMTAIGY